MWLLPTRGRPHLVNRFIKACEVYGLPTDVYVMLDLDDAGNYKAVDWPFGWVVEVRERVSIAERMNHAVRCVSPFYGLLNDDAVPETEGWHFKLEEKCLEKGIAWPDDCWEHKCTFPVVRADFVKAQGWFALPGLKHLWIDTVWGDMAEKLKIQGYVPEVKLRHMFHGNGGVNDDTYHHRMDGGQDSYQHWKANVLPCM